MCDVAHFVAGQSRPVLGRVAGATRSFTPSRRGGSSPFREEEVAPVTLSQPRAPHGPVRDPETDLAAGLTGAPTQPRSGVVLARVLGEVDILTADRLGEVLDGALATVATERDAGADAAGGETPAVVCDLG